MVLNSADSDKSAVTVVNTTPDKSVKMFYIGNIKRRDTVLGIYYDVMEGVNLAHNFYLFPKIVLFAIDDLLRGHSFYTDAYHHAAALPRPWCLPQMLSTTATPLASTEGDASQSL